MVTLLYKSGDRAVVVGGTYYRTATKIYLTVLQDISKPGFVNIVFDKAQYARGSFVSRTNTRLHTQSLRKISPSANKDPEKTEGKFPLDALDIVTLDEVDIPDDVKEKIRDLCADFRRLGMKSDSTQAGALVRIGMRKNTE